MYNKNDKYIKEQNKKSSGTVMQNQRGSLWKD